ncbi:hypothetical protein [Saccharothrix syringae]|uniref:hypothetical protein n=1 Tax=Saccharothrix syringae TaxID=103733 RepID=UPI00147749C9|nr:hypothetical protein [Saccharothrix syringae]
MPRGPVAATAHGGRGRRTHHDPTRKSRTEYHPPSIGEPTAWPPNAADDRSAS